MPVVGDLVVGVGEVAGEAATCLAEPIGDVAIVVAPQHIVNGVAVEVSG